MKHYWNGYKGIGSIGALLTGSLRFSDRSYPSVVCLSYSGNGFTSLSFFDYSLRPVQCTLLFDFLSLHLDNLIREKGPYMGPTSATVSSGTQHWSSIGSNSNILISSHLLSRLVGLPSHLFQLCTLGPCPGAESTCFHYLFNLLFESPRLLMRDLWGEYMYLVDIWAT